MATWNTFQTRLEGIDKTIAAAKELERRIKRGGMRTALNKATTPTLQKARRLAPRESGLLRKSLKKKVTTNTREDTVTVIIGSDKSVSGTFKGEKRTPARYAHLVEMGHGGPHSAAPHPFLRPAWESTKIEVQRIYKAELKGAIEKRTARLAKR
jgi:HK97 gp10 family phage protein